MTKLLKATIFLFSVVFILSCSKDDELEVDDSYAIEFGSECGWCAGSGFISLKKGEIKYIRNIPCGENQGTDKINQVFTYADWEELVACFDYAYFTTLDYNVCNVCADGCDEIIRITKDDEVREIRYNPTENIEGLETLQEKLREYLAEFYEPY